MLFSGLRTSCYFKDSSGKEGIARLENKISRISNVAEFGGIFVERLWGEWMRSGEK
jgi:hypothetical protein